MLRAGSEVIPLPTGQAAGCQLRATRVYSRAFQNLRGHGLSPCPLGGRFGCTAGPGSVGAYLLLRPRVLPIMEINPILNSIKDLSERSQAIRGYL